MTYATVEDIEVRTQKTFNEAEREACEKLLEDVAVVIDCYNKAASEDVKKLVSCNIVNRLMTTSMSDVPIGANQGSISALGYSQSWTVSNGSVGEIYLTKLDKKLLGVGNHIGVSNPFAEA